MLFRSKHVVTEAPPLRATAGPLSFMISTKDRPALLALAKRYADRLDAGSPSTPLADIS